MKHAKWMYTLGRLLFAFMWLPFLCIFAGNAPEIFGSAGFRFAERVNQILPGLMSTSAGEFSRLSEISTVVTLGLSLLSMALIFGSTGVSAYTNQKLRNIGKSANAKVVSMVSTGTRINNNAVMRFVLEVEPGDRSAFHAEAEQIMRPESLGRLQPGAVVPVRYDPDTQEAVITDL